MQHPQHHERYHGGKGWPDGSLAVLKHGQQCAGDGGHQRYAVEYDGRHIAHRMDVGGIEVEKIPPHMA